MFLWELSIFSAVTLVLVVLVSKRQDILSSFGAIVALFLLSLLLVLPFFRESSPSCLEPVRSSSCCSRVWSYTLLVSFIFFTSFSGTGASSFAYLLNLFFKNLNIFFCCLSFPVVCTTFYSSLSHTHSLFY